MTWTGLFGGVRAPSTLGSFLRSFTWGNVLQLGKVNRLLLAELARRAPLLPGKDVLAFIDIDSQQKRVYGRKKQGAAFGHTKLQGKSLLIRRLNALAATISTPLGAPVIAATRLRGGNAASTRGAPSFAAEAVRTARATGGSGIVMVRADSAFYSAAFTRAVRAGGAFFSVTVQMNPHVAAAIAAISEDVWTAIRYPRRSGMTSSADGQEEMFPAWRYHALLTDSPFVTLQAEAQHRSHAQVEQVLADWTDGPLAHLASGSFPANAAWLTSPRSATTCCAPPLPWPALATPTPAAPPSAATSSTSPPVSPGTAAATSPCTCPTAGTGNTNGTTCSPQPAGRHRQHPDQPGPGHRIHAGRPAIQSRPRPSKPDKPQEQSAARRLHPDRRQ
jgi:hypothetical protein